MDSFQQQIQNNFNEIEILEKDFDVKKYIQLEREFKFAVLNSRRGIYNEFTLENSIKLDEIQSQIMKLSSLEKVKKYNYLLYNIKVLLSRLESLKKYYDKCNNKLGMLNREIAQLEFKLLKNDKEREF